MRAPDVARARQNDPDASVCPAGERRACSVWICGPGGEPLSLPEPCPLLAGVMLEVCRGSGWVEALHPEDADAVLAGWRESLAAGTPWRCTYRIRGEDGEYLTVASRGVPVRDAADRVLFWVGISLDATVRDEPHREDPAMLSAVSIMERSGVPIDEILRVIAAVLAGWLDLEEAGIRIAFEGREYRSPGYVETSRRQESPLLVHGRTAGRVEICYREGEGSFLADGRPLADAVAIRLGRVIEQVQPTSGRADEGYRRLYEQMLESYTLYEVIRDGAGNPVDYRILELNEKAADLFGRSREELVGRRLFDVFPAIREGARLLYGEVADQGVPVQRRLQEPRSGRWYDLYIFRLEVGRLAVVGQEITEQKRAERALRESEERFRKIAQRSFDMIFICDADRGITYISPAVARILGYTPEEMTGRRCRDYLLERALPGWQEVRRRIAQGESVEGVLVEFCRKDGTVAVIEMNCSPVVEDETVIGVQVVGRDVSDRKRHEALRLQAFEQIEQNIEQFAVLADHIRLPLQVILGMADLIEDGPASERIREQVKRINGIVKQLDEGWVESREIREFLRRNELV
ncbi:PAS domain S-box protein [Methanoculleus sp.]|uniref:PAS domain S-box protein n=1 Tax=Methanoculleus sp. TaxID=90427 RepID=UPI0025EEB1AB|nr:PAS domain S-box protein [Methanoculleus sp.]